MELKQSAFMVGAKTVTIEEILRFGEEFGLLDDAWLRLQSALADEAPEPDDDALLVAADGFRLERDLISAQETEDWLADRGLTTDDLHDFLRRQFAAEACGRPDSPRRLRDATAHERTLLLTDLMLTGSLAELTEQLAWRYAALASLTEHSVQSSPEALEHAFQQRSLEFTNDSAMSRLLGEIRLSLIRFDCHMLELDDEASAREAYYCLTGDGLTMEEVASESACPMQHLVLGQAELAEPLASLLMAASEGDIIPPQPRGEAKVVIQLVKKLEPSPADPEVRSILARELIRRGFRDLAARHIQWLFTPLRPA